MSDIFARLLQQESKQQRQLEQPEPTSRAKAVIYESPENDSTTARQHTVPTASPTDSTLSGQHDSPPDYFLSFLQAKATNKTTLRYPPSLMSEVDEVIYQVKKTYHVNLSKNAIFVLALAYILDNFRHDASQSLLFRHLIGPKSG